MNKQNVLIIDEVKRMLQGDKAHVSLEIALRDLPAKMRGEVFGNLPYSIWQIVEHIRIAQWDMLKFSKDGTHKSPKWPDECWPKEAAPVNDDVWHKSIQRIKSDLEEFINLLDKEDVYKRIPHGDGQTILREALQIADHNAYHTAEIVVIRRLLGVWRSARTS